MRTCSRPHFHQRPRHLLRSLLAAAAALAAVTGLLAPSHPGTAAHAATPGLRLVDAAHRPVRHVFVIMLENKGFAETFGPRSKAPYLARTLTRRGQLLTGFYGVAHHSLPNYLAQISGQAPNRATQADCHTYSAFQQTGTRSPGQAVGRGCVYPATVKTVADQLTAAHLSWRAYEDGMGAGCRHPRLGAVDQTVHASARSEYTTRHNPFLYFRSIIGSPSCARHDVDLSHLPGDLRTVATTANLTYLTPDLCHDGHDRPCADGRPGGLVTADRWLRTWVPKILTAPAFGKDGLLVITSDEADGVTSAACCGLQAGPNTTRPGITGPGGGRVGAVVLSPSVTPGTRSAVGYNHYSLLATIEDTFGLPRLGFARGARAFGSDVFTR